jgi:endonuclease/exonuclease/phosphatase family metal-dependent hydrolase
MAELKVMTLNVRQPDLDDGSHAWEFRRQLLVETIRAADPDLIGAQELFTLQAEYILDQTTQYDWFGKGRFGDDRDKHVGIFFKTSGLRLLAQGDFWLSETPDVVGSSSWEIVRPRQVTWGHFETRSGERFHHFNTHFPYRPVEQEARRRTAALLQSRVGQCNPVVLTADFNSPADGEIYQMLATDFSDAWRTAHRQSGPTGTLNGFGRVQEPRRIDWILYRAPWKVLEAATIPATKDGIYPSDHFPVMARFEMGPA